MLLLLLLLHTVKRSCFAFNGVRLGFLMVAIAVALVLTIVHGLVGRVVETGAHLPRLHVIFIALLRPPPPLCSSHSGCSVILYNTPRAMWAVGRVGRQFNISFVTSYPVSCHTHILSLCVSVCVGESRSEKPLMKKDYGRLVNFRAKMGFKNSIYRLVCKILRALIIIGPPPPHFLPFYVSPS